MGSQGSLSEESDISAEPWLRGVWWGELRAAGMVDTKLWGSERVRGVLEGSRGNVAGDRREMDTYQGAGLCPKGDGVGGHPCDRGGEELDVSFRPTMWPSTQNRNSEELVRVLAKL